MFTLEKRKVPTLMFEDALKEMDSFFGKNYYSNRIKANFIENDESFTLETLAPGLNKSDIEISLDGFKIKIKYEKNKEKNEDYSNYTLREFSSKSFERVFVLPKTSNLDDITSKYENGVLYVEIPKKEMEKNNKRTISVS